MNPLLRCSTCGSIRASKAEAELCCADAYAVATDQNILKIALAVLSRNYADLVTRLMRAETLTQGELMRHGANIGPAYWTPELAQRFGKKKRKGET